MHRLRPFLPVLLILFCFGTMVAGLPALSAMPAARAVAQSETEIPLRLRVGTFDPLAPSPLVQAAAPDLLTSDRPRLRLVQFPGPIQDEWYQAMLDAQLEIVAYVPDYAYLVWGAEAGVRQVEAGTPVRWAGVYHPTFAVHPALSSTGDEQDVDVLVQVYEHTGAEKTIQSILENAGQVLRTPHSQLGFHVVGVRIDTGQLEWLAAQPGVVSVEPAPNYALLDERQGQILAGNVTDDGSRPAGPGYLTWLTDDVGVSTDPVDYPIVDVTDDGIDVGSGTPEHPDFYEFGDTANGDRLMYNYNWTSDPAADGEGGHGTLNASIAVGYNDGTGFPFEDADGYSHGLGINPFGRVAGSKVFNNSGGWDLNGSYVDLISTTYALGARISSNSWACTNCNGDYRIDDQTYDALVRDAQPGIGSNEETHILFAAGNGGPAATTTGSPANAKNVVTVGAAENYRPAGTDNCGFGPSSADDAQDVASFSGRGPTDDGRIKPDLVAPGTHIMGAASPDPEYTGAGVCGPAYYPAGQTLYTWSTGTSHATPAAAGAASLLDHYYREHVADGQAPSPAMLKAYMINSTRYLTGNGAGDTLPSNSQGFGELNMGIAVEDVSRIIVDQSEVFHESGETFEVHGKVGDPARPLRVTLAWTDAPGMPGAAAYVNDLNLEVTVGGTLYRGNVFSGATSVGGGSADFRNNVESVFLPAGQSGPLVVRVTAANVAGDGLPGNDDPTDQDFALIVSNGEQQAGIIEGTIRDSTTDAPIADAAVRATGGTATYTTTSAADGSYVLTVLPDSYTVRAWKYGYGPATASNVSVADDGTVTRDLALTPTDSYVLTGRVSDATTDAGLSATMTIRGPLGDVVTRTTTVPASGRYTVTLAGSPYSVTADARLHDSATGTVSLTEDTELDFALQATTTDGILWGYVTNQSTGGPVADATIRVQPGMTETRSGLEGGYELQLPPGPYSVSVSAPLYSTVTETNVVVPQSNFVRRDYTLPVAQLELRPAGGVSATLEAGNTSVVTATLGNSGDGHLSFEIFEFAGDVQPVGGPDTFGYTYWDNSETPATRFEWIESTDGTEIPLGDDTAATIELPFTFDFYGTRSTTLRVSNNGGATFDSTTDALSWQNEPLSATNYRNVIAPFWDDLDDRIGAVYYKTLGASPQRRFVVTWHERAHYGGDVDGVSFQMILYEETNNFKFQYQDVVFGADEWDHGNSATIGIRGGDGQYLEYGYNSSVLRDGLALCFDYPGTPPCDAGDIPWLTVLPTDGIVPPSSNVPLTITVTTSDAMQTGTYTGSLRLYTNDPAAQPYVPYPVTLTVPAFGVELTPRENLALGAAGSAVTHTFRVTNVGSTTDTFAVTTSDATPGWNPAGSASILTLPPGGTRDVRFRVEIPATVAAGTRDTVTVTVTSQTAPAVQQTATMTSVAAYQIRLLYIQR